MNDHSVEEGLQQQIVDEEVQLEDVLGVIVKFVDQFQHQYRLLFHFLLHILINLLDYYQQSAEDFQFLLFVFHILLDFDKPFLIVDGYLLLVYCLDLRDNDKVFLIKLQLYLYIFTPISHEDSNLLIDSLLAEMAQSNINSFSVQIRFSAVIKRIYHYLNHVVVEFHLEFLHFLQIIVITYPHFIIENCSVA